MGLQYVYLDICEVFSNHDWLVGCWYLRWKWGPVPLIMFIVTHSGVDEVAPEGADDDMG